MVRYSIGSARRDRSSHLYTQSSWEPSRSVVPPSSSIKRIKENPKNFFSFFSLAENDRRPEHLLKSCELYNTLLPSYLNYNARLYNLYVKNILFLISIYTRLLTHTPLFSPTFLPFLFPSLQSSLPPYPSPIIA